jgi:hypothetical protein
MGNNGNPPLNNLAVCRFFSHSYGSPSGGHGPPSHSIPNDLIQAADDRQPDQCWYEKNDRECYSYSYGYLPSKMAIEEPDEESINSYRHDNSYGNLHCPDNSRWNSDSASLTESRIYTPDIEVPDKYCREEDDRYGYYQCYYEFPLHHLHLPSSWDKPEVGELWS